MNRHLRAMLWRITDHGTFREVAAATLLAAFVLAPIVLWAVRGFK